MFCTSLKICCFWPPLPRTGWAQLRPSLKIQQKIWWEEMFPQTPFLMFRSVCNDILHSWPNNPDVVFCKYLPLFPSLGSIATCSEARVAYKLKIFNEHNQDPSSKSVQKDLSRSRAQDLLRLGFRFLWHVFFAGTISRCSVREWIPMARVSNSDPNPTAF